MKSSLTTDRVGLARQCFFRDGMPPDSTVEAPILRSWRRCAERGLDVATFPKIEPMTAQELRQIADAHDRLRHITRPELQALCREVERNGSVVILSGPDGTVLDSLGSADFATRAAQVALRPGVRWSEDVTGTNAIGTALCERRPVEVHGGEHYFERHSVLTCAAAPIFDPRGQIIGALDISGSSRADHRFALGLVRLAVEQIEHRFFDDGFADADVIRFHRDPDLLGTPREGILVFRDGRLVAANRWGLELMRLDWSALDTCRASELFMYLPKAAGGIGRTQRQDGQPLFARLTCRAPTAVPVPKIASQPASAWFDQAGEAMLAKAKRLIDAKIPLLLNGETGSGKEVFARRAHALSARREGPFIPVNCAALPESLIESELFGYTEGAFTGARKQGIKGLIREADKGILFLDEIGDMPLVLQARLLRVLQDWQVKPLGGGNAVAVDFALICATHRDLEALVAAGEFRQDLYYRLAQYPFVLPALRSFADRRVVIGEMIARYAPNLTLLPDTEILMASYDWPGNFRELTDTLRVLSALCEDGAPVCSDMLPPQIRGCGSSLAKAAAAEAPTGKLEDIEIGAMQHALDLHKGNISRAARALGINRSTLYRRLKLS